MPGNLMYKYLPYALGRQKYVLELAAGICMLFAQRLLSAPPFVVSFPCKANKRKYEVTFTAIFEHNSCIIIVQKKKKETILALTSRSGECCNLTCKTSTLMYILVHSNRICGILTLHECNYVGRKCY